MTFRQISQRGKETAETMLRAVQTMTDRAIAGQLKAFADDCQQRAEKASHVDAVITVISGDEDAVATCALTDAA